MTGPPPNLPDPEGLRSERMVRFFAGVMARSMAGSFHAVRIAGQGAPALSAEAPVLVYSNHPGWWDPALMIVLASRLFPDRAHFGPMDAAALERYRFMARIGLFPVVPDSAAGAVAFMKTSLHLLRRPDTMLWVTAQGRFADPRERPLALRRGIAELITRAPRLTVLPLAIEYPFWDEKQPEALCSFGPAIDSAAMPGLKPDEWHALLEVSLGDVMDGLAEAARTRNPAGFETLISGRVGVGGVYGLWGRLRALVRGERYDPAHAGVARRRD